MGKFGEKLRREREMRAVTLEEIAEATKIGTRSLKALEDEHFSILPGGIFNKGFVRAYARYLGIDQEQAVNDYLAAAGEAQPEETDSKEISEIATQADAARQRREALMAASGQSTGGNWLVWAALVLLVAAGAGGWKYYEQWKAHRAETEAKMAAATAVPPAATTPVVAAPIDTNAQPVTADPNATQGSSATTDLNATTPGSPAGTSQSTSPDKRANSAEPLPAEFQVQVHAKERTWVRITSDEIVVKEGMLSADEEGTYAAKTKLVLVSGKPGAVDIQWNGKKQLLPQVTTRSQVLTFTPEGLKP